MQQPFALPVTEITVSNQSLGNRLGFRDVQAAIGHALQPSIQIFRVDKTAFADDAQKRTTSQANGHDASATGK